MNDRNLYLVAFAMLAAWSLAASAQDAAAEPKPAETAAATQPPQPARIPKELEERYEHMAAQLKEPVRKRDLQVQAVPSVTVPLTRPDPKLLENKFAVEFVLVIGGVDPKNPESMAKYLRQRELDLGWFGQYSEDIRELLLIGKELLMYSRSRASDAAAVPEHLARLAERCPPAQRPDERLVKLLTAAKGSGDVRLEHGKFASDNRRRDNYVDQLRFVILAPTAEEAEQRAEAIVQLYDGGLCRPMQRYLFGEGQRAYELLGDKYEELKPITAAIQTESEKLAAPSEISGDILSQLKAQKVMVAVELAGLSARVKACDAMLADPKKLEISTLQSISDMKVKAEIERVGIKEKLDQINTFIAEGDARHAAFEAQAALAKRREKVRQDIHDLQRSASIYAELFELYAPFRVPDNQITIGPIEWTQE